MHTCSFGCTCLHVHAGLPERHLSVWAEVEVQSSPPRSYLPAVVESEILSPPVLMNGGKGALAKAEDALAHLRSLPKLRSPSHPPRVISEVQLHPHSPLISAVKSLVPTRLESPKPCVPRRDEPKLTAPGALLPATSSPPCRLPAPVISEVPTDGTSGASPQSQFGLWSEMANSRRRLLSPKERVADEISLEGIRRGVQLAIDSNTYGPFVHSCTQVVTTATAST